MFALKFSEINCFFPRMKRKKMKIWVEVMMTILTMVSFILKPNLIAEEIINIISVIGWYLTLCTQLFFLSILTSKSRLFCKYLQNRFRKFLKNYMKWIKTQTRLQNLWFVGVCIIVKCCSAHPFRFILTKVNLNHPLILDL